jgi:uncharacterized protein DUF1902
LWYPFGLMRDPVYHVHVTWDPEARVWVATSEDILGLAVEAPTLQALARKLRILIPELLGADPADLPLS